MPQASGSRHSIGYVPEVTFGVTPATPVFKALRHNSTTLGLEKGTFGSNELRADRMIADLRHGTRSVGGTVTGELSRESYDDMLEAALCGTWAANVLKAGTVRRSFTIERNFSDVGDYLRYVGMQVDTLQLTMSTGGIVGVVLGFLGMDMDTDTAIIAGATYPAAPSTSPMDALSGSMSEGGVAMAVATEVTLNLSNGLESRFVIGSDRSLEPSIGRSTLTGSLSAYFEDAGLYQKFLDEDTSSLEVTVGDGIGNFYEILVPRLKYTGGDLPTPGEGPISITMPFQALLDSATGTSFQITRTLAP